MAKSIGESFGALLLGAFIVRFIGTAGIDAIRRVFGLLVMAIGVEMIVHGINEHEAFRALLG